MPSPTYSALVSAVGKYIDGAKAKDIVDRQLARSGAGATPDSLDKNNSAKVIAAVATAAGLYVADQIQRQEMVERLKGVA